MIASAIRASRQSIDEQHRRDGDDRHHVLDEEDQPVAEEEADGLEVDRRARHQLARLVAVVEAEREPQEVRVEAVAHVVLDGERLPARDQPAADHEERLGHADRDDAADLERERRSVPVALERVHDGAGEEDDHDGAALREDGQQRGDDQRAAVGAQEAEQAGEGPAVGRPAHRPSVAAPLAPARLRLDTAGLWSFRRRGMRAAATSRSPTR